MDTERTNITREVGSRIRYAHKSRGMSMDELAQAIYKTRSAISKYENGQISVDIATLYDIANALKVSIYDLLHRNTPDIGQEYNAEVPAFFRNVSQLYMYFFDGRINRAQCTVIDIFPAERSSQAEVLMYMNVKDLAHYQICESTFRGTLTHYEAFSAMLFENNDMPMDKYQIGIPQPYMDDDRKWVLTYGISCRPLMPSAAKRLLSKTPLPIDKALVQELMISKEDIRLMKHYNMFVMV